MEAQPVHSLDMVPPWNQETYRLLFIVENVLRELITEMLTKEHGAEWLQHLPNDIRDKCEGGRDQEKADRTRAFLYHDTLYYSDFPDLAKIIEMKSGWKMIFAQIFGRKETFLGSLRSIEGIRNKTAHNRILTQTDSDAVQNIYSMLINALGEDRMASLIARTNRFLTLESTLGNLSEEICLARDEVLSLGRLSERNVWQRIWAEEWLNVEIPGYDIDILIRLFDTLQSYESLPKGLPGYRIQNWCRESQIAQMFESAEQSLDVLRRWIGAH